MEVFKTWNDTLMLNGKPVQMEIQIKTSHDDYYDDSCDDDATKRKVARGDISPMLLVVSVSALDEEGWDSLGGCLITGPDDVDAMVAENDMVANAKEHLLQTIKDKCQLLAPYCQCA